MNNIKVKGLLIVLFEIGLGFKFNLVGAISLSEIFLFAYIIIFLFSNKKVFSENPLLRQISFLYLGLFLSQLVSEVLIANTFSNSLKGLSVTLVSYIHFIFLLNFFIKDRVYVLYALLGKTLSLIIFGSNVEVSGTVGDALSGEGASFLKFYLAPIAINALLIASAIVGNNLRKIYPIIVVFIGLFLVVLGARSAGVTFSLTGLMAYFISRGKKFDLSSLRKIVVFTIFIGYGLYVVYVNQVVNGNITSGNSQQLLQVENPYNPIYLFMKGRSETFVGWIAFTDKFWLGHGAWAQDVTGKYQTLLLLLHDSEDKIDTSVFADGIIPSHSVLIGSGMQNGIMAFLFMILILYFFIKTGANAIDKKDPYLIIIVSFIFSLIWVGLFSAPPSFKNGLPLNFAMLLAFYISKRKVMRSNLKA
jgi:hypothetical protein